MNGGIVTECPECETRFNVSEGQLKLADGKVRCGACLRVFDAKSHQPYSEQLQPPAENAVAQRPTPQQEYSLHVRYAQTSDRTPAQTRTSTGALSTDSPPFDPDAPLEVSSATETPRQHKDGHSPAAPSAPIAIASFLRTPAQHATPEERPERMSEQPPVEQPAVVPVPPPVGKPAQKDTAEPATTQDPAPERDEPAAHRTLAKPGSRTESQTAAAEPVEDVTAAPMPVETGVTQAPPASDRPHPLPVAEHPPAQPAMPGAQPEPPPAPQPQGLAALQDLHAEPLELAHPATPAAPGAVLGWSLGCLAACVLLASQLAWFNRIEWSRQPALAEFYDILCHQVECAIPPHQAIEFIHNRQLVVRAHPRFEDALSIDLLLENTADFRQPFPAIELSFSDIRGRTVARRILQPRDYLDDALDPLKMAHSQPFQVNLAIQDPGRRAVSYEVQLAPARL
ncbi:zinc-ribbon and DUF3426 domain-containing protein [Marinobacterium rhizophilum]|uniref:Zinc-ribbon domain-containing protein n=1 Tax=Marinobacterium rhizophilum TaxID=420402 RepID=A0ABY5HHJ9_9GAMM|nr:DUF3426 domain-containing protein [Marinobacterium rhizophilum]UTW11835.1 zinc-ribbon domain-containing protein [Marinobacterium rhizophilum]